MTVQIRQAQIAIFQEVLGALTSNGIERNAEHQMLGFSDIKLWKHGCYVLGQNNEITFAQTHAKVLAAVEAF